jgi:hypothetical protein
MSQPHKRLLVLAFCLLLIFPLYLAIRPSGTYRIGFGTGYLYFIKQGWLENEECKIEFRNGKWGWFRHGFWTEIAIPYESPMNDYYNFVLDRGGIIYMVSKDKLERHEVRYFDGDWHWQDTATGEWLEFPGPNDY